MPKFKITSVSQATPYYYYFEENNRRHPRSSVADLLRRTRLSRLKSNVEIIAKST